MAKDFYQYENLMDRRDQKNYIENHILKALRALNAGLSCEAGMWSDSSEMIPQDLARAKNHLEMAYYILTCEAYIGDENVRNWYEMAYEAKKEKEE